MVGDRYSREGDVTYVDIVGGGVSCVSGEAIPPLAEARGTAFETV